MSDARAKVRDAGRRVRVARRAERISPVW